ncbi:MAG: GNAT family N-acetyltransferase [Thalassobaculaceae bacterium]|nr:GNAT family N-acetyltransferase [Thalassobaculaceae bacterium]
MAIEWSDSLDDIDWQELADLVRAAPLGDKTPEFLCTVFSNSMYRVFVRDEGKLVGAGRALADGVDCAYLGDIVILPSHQGQGLGGQIITRLLESVKGYRKVLLYAVPGKEPLYRKYGFRRMTTAMAIFQDQGAAFERGYLRED